MPGVVVSVEAELGERVEAGSVLLTIEAMKMEHTIVAPISGRVTTARVVVGDRVGMDEEIIVIQADPEEGIDRGEDSVSR
jgi:biotin carboxyl carrier protein